MCSWGGKPGVSSHQGCYQAGSHTPLEPCWCSGSSTQAGLGGQVPKGRVTEEIDACFFLLHVSSDVFTGAWQQWGPGAICCNFLRSWLAEWW